MDKRKLIKAHERLQGIWHSMLSRCENEKNASYRRYGMRGIGVCKDWHDFDKFFLWALSNGYKATLTLDRIDNTKGYSPDNCRWITVKEQNNNKTNVPLYQWEYNGKEQSHTLTEWCKILELDVGIVRNMMNMHNIQLNDIFAIPAEILNIKVHTIWGYTKTIVQWANFIDEPVRNLYEALAKRISIPDYIKQQYEKLVITGKRPAIL